MPPDYLSECKLKWLYNISIARDSDEANDPEEICLGK